MLKAASNTCCYQTWKSSLQLPFNVSQLQYYKTFNSLHAARHFSHIPSMITHIMQVARSIRTSIRGNGVKKKRPLPPEKADRSLKLLTIICRFDKSPPIYKCHWRLCEQWFLISLQHKARMKEVKRPCNKAVHTCSSDILLRSISLIKIAIVRHNNRLP